MRAFRRTAALLLAAAACLAQAVVTPALACTSMLLRTGDGGFVYGRTMEFALPLDSQGLVIPRNLKITGTGPNGEAGTGLSWTTKYGAVGMNGVGLPVLVDGMNERGLAGGLLYLPGVAEFQDVVPADATRSIASFELLTYILTNFATVAEVKAELPKIYVNRAPQAVFKMPVPIHATLHDATGKSIVVEYVRGGQLTIYDNPTSILTNGPTFDWHLANLGQYLNLGASEPKSLEIGSLTIAPASTGAGLHGLPGDMLSPSRFVRAFFFARNAPVAPTSADGVTLVTHLMNNFDIAPGSIATSATSASGGGIDGYEITEWTVSADLKTLRYYVSTYDNRLQRVIDLSKADLAAPAIRFLAMDQRADAMVLQ
jgi:choloylglycine hydrolase